MRRRLLWTLLAFLVCAVPASAAGNPVPVPPPGPRTLTFEDRVRAQEAIERVYYSHQLGTTKRFEDAVPRSVLEAKVRKYLDQSAALQVFWKTPVTDLALDRELERMAAGTRMPERLMELFAALGNDAFLIKECLARATLVDRLTRNFFAFDTAIHAGSKTRAELLRQKLLKGLSSEISGARQTIAEVVIGKPDANRPDRIALTAAEFRNRRRTLPKEVGDISDVVESRDDYSVSVVLGMTSDAVKLATFTVPKVSFDTWHEGHRAELAGVGVASVATAGVPSAVPKNWRPGPANAAAVGRDDTWDNGSLEDVVGQLRFQGTVWTGTEMVIWGGWDGFATTATGRRYDPATDTWSPTSLLGAPTDRAGASVVWTGSSMIVWGGFGDGTGGKDTGARYNPLTDQWTSMSNVGAPSPRSFHTAVWTGSRMVIWGGDGDAAFLATGGSYDPDTDSWSPTSLVDAPSAREGHTAVWTGSSMLVWGGLANDYSRLNTGGRYDPTTDTWTPTRVPGAPLPRDTHCAVWTGSRMIVWGGDDRAGGLYDPVADSWSATTLTGAPVDRYAFTSVWTGHEMIVWGGYANTADPFTNAAYDPVLDRWREISSAGAPVDRGFHSAVWTGNLMVVWGGDSVTGGRYDPVSNTWTPTAPVDGVVSRYGHSTIWTGNEMIVWGGLDGISHPEALVATGGRYNPVLDVWTPTSQSGAPSPRGQHSAVWTGTRMIVWGGGNDVEAYPNVGGVYDPLTDSWTPTSSVGAPPVASLGTAVWSGQEMLVWSTRFGTSYQPVGGRYNPSTDSWRSISVVGAPSVRVDHAAIWTGSRMVIWGGYGPGGTEVGNGGGRYDPTTDSWSSTSTLGAPEGRTQFASAWTGTELFVWGGRGLLGAPFLASGGRYDPVANQWAPVSSTNSPAARAEHSAVWTGAYVVVWGGEGDTTEYGDGGRYDPAHDQWLGMTNERAPSPRWFHSAIWADPWMIVWGGRAHQYYAAAGGRYVSCDPSEIDADGDGSAACNGGDCDDSRSGVHPGATEVCNGRDDDCDGVIDNGGDLLCDGAEPCASEQCRGIDGCIAVSADAGTACDDSSICTESDQCDGMGHCFGQSICDDGNPCTDDTCDPALGCVYDYYPAGESCSDGNPCNGSEACDGAGLCAAGAQLDCDDHDPCTDDACNPSVGCVHTNNTSGCDDGDACTRTDVCAAGACTGTNPVVCNAADQCHDAGSCNPATGTCSTSVKPDGTACSDGSLCTTGDSCQSGTCTPSFSGLTEPNPRSNGYYKRLCISEHSGDQLTDADAVCVATVASTFTGFTTVADLCAELLPGQPNNDACDRADDDLLTLALNICRARVCTLQGIDSQCGSNGSVGQSLAQSDAILASPSRNAASCAQAKCLDEEINTGRALELNTLTLAREGTGVRLRWAPPFLEDGTAQPPKYHVWRRQAGSLAPFVKLGSTSLPTFLDAAPGAYEYEVTAVMN